MRIGPKYKIARRLGAPVFEKTQSHKYAQSQARKEKTKGTFRRPKSDFGIQLLEKQKARYTYGVAERQFAKYAKAATAKKGTHAVEHLFESLELRADNVVYRVGFAPTRLAARQMVSHGHITVNGRKITIPSLKLREGDVIGIRPGSQTKALFGSLEERLKTYNVPNWISFDKDKKVAEIRALPHYEGAESLFDINAILEFYSR